MIAACVLARCRWISRVQLFSVFRRRSSRSRLSAAPAFLFGSSSKRKTTPSRSSTRYFDSATPTPSCPKTQTNSRPARPGPCPERKVRSRERPWRAATFLASGSRMTTNLAARAKGRKLYNHWPGVLSSAMVHHVQFLLPLAGWVPRSSHRLLHCRVLRAGLRGKRGEASASSWSM